MSEMTDEEADYWDELFTKNPPKVDPNRKGGYFSRQNEEAISLKNREDTFEYEIPNEETIKAMEEEELFSANSVEEMIEDSLKDPD
jgi:hypothetical protein